MSTYAPPPDFAPYRTNDGSLTLRSVQLDEHYHSVVGALRESRHVYIDAGLRWIKGEHIDLLEVGLGTGLNLLLSWIEAERSGSMISYTAIEPFPVDLAALRALDHATICGVEEKRSRFEELMTTSANAWMDVDDHLRFRRIERPVQELTDEAAYDVVYFDAFGPNTQPEMWTLDVFARTYRALRPGGILVTYCAKGEVRRTMQAAGFSVERLQGPPGKREMLRATKPIDTTDA